MRRICLISRVFFAALALAVMGVGAGFAQTIPLPIASTVLAVDAGQNAGAVVVDNTAGLSQGQRAQIQLDDNSTFSTTISGIAGSMVRLADPLPGPASIGSSFAVIRN